MTGVRSLVEDNHDDVEFSLVASSTGNSVARDEEALGYLCFRAAYRSQATEIPKAAPLELGYQPSSAAEREL